MYTFENLIKAIESGKKIEFDKKTQTIKTIEGVSIKDGEDDIIFDFTKVSDEEIKEIQKNCHYSKALYNPVKRGIILIDIVDYSKNNNNLYQAAALEILNTAMKNFIFLTKPKLQLKREIVFEKIISTGDGYYIIFNNELNEIFFRTAISFISEIYFAQKNIFSKFGREINKNKMIHVRMSCTLGDVDFFKDVIEANNCYGNGLNEAARILSSGRDAIGDNNQKDTYDTIFIDQSLVEQATNFKPLIKRISGSYEIEIKELQVKPDKHNNERRIWWIKNLPISRFDLFSLDNTLNS